MKNNTKVAIATVVCVIAVLFSMSLSSCGIIENAKTKQKISNVQSMAERGIQWMPEHCSSVLYRTSHKDIFDGKSTDNTTIVTVSPTYTWYHKSIDIGEDSNQDESNNTASFFSVIAQDGEVYGGIECGLEKDVSSQKLIQYKIVGANSENLITFAKSLVREYNGKANDTVKEFFNEDKSIKKEYSSEEDDTGSESRITNSGTFYSMGCTKEDMLIGGLSVGIQNDNDTVYLLSTSKYSLYDSETLILRGNNGFEEEAKSGKLEEELEEISLEDFLKKAEVLLSDSEISNAAHSIR